jgi:hypothetical protein
MIRIEKSSKLRKSNKQIGAEYMLLYRMRVELGELVVSKALEGCEKSLAKIEKYAWEPKKRPAVVAWLKKHKLRLSRAARV